MAGTLLVFGGGGFVGGHLCARALRQGWKVHIADPIVRDSLAGADWHSLDIRDEAGVRDLVAGLRPTAVVDLAAVADVDKAERERELARSINTDAAGIIASSCAAVGSRCIYFSSDAVFAGTAERYVEEDAPAPVNWYGRTKADGERAVREACPNAIIVRISLVLGFPVTDGNSFLAGLEQKLTAGTVVPCPVDEIRTPIDAGTLTACVLELCAAPWSGPIHLGATDSVDRFTLTRRAASLMGFAETLVTVQPSGASPKGRAARHARGVISVEKAQRLLSTPLVRWEETLRKAVAERPGKG